MIFAAAAAGFLILSVAQTWPLALVFSHGLAGFPGDASQNCWNMWWVRESVFIRHSSPFFTDMLHYPLGAPLYLHTLDLPDGLLAGIFLGRLPMPAVYNAFIIFGDVLSGLAVFLLARHLLARAEVAEPRRSLAAFMAGCFFAFSVFRGAHALGHLHIHSLYWVPMGLWFLCAASASDRMSSKTALLAAAAASAAIAGLVSPYGAMFFFAAVFILACCGAVRLKESAVAAGAALLLALPFLVPAVKSAFAESYFGAHDPNIFSADLLSFFIPNELSRLGAFSRAASAAWTGNSSENCGYMGYALLALSAAGAWKFRAARAWVVVAACGALLALGPRLHFNGHILGLPMPYALAEKIIPGLHYSGAPARWSFLSAMGLSVAACFGLALVMGRRRGMLIAAALAALAFAESWPARMPVCSYPSPQIFVELKHKPLAAGGPARGPAVLDLTPLPQATWNQTIHGLPMLGGWLSRSPTRLVDWAKARPFLWGMVETFRAGKPWNPPVSAASRRAARNELLQAGVRYIVLPDTPDAARVMRVISAKSLFRGDGMIIGEL